MESVRWCKEGLSELVRPISGMKNSFPYHCKYNLFANTVRIHINFSFSFSLQANTFSVRQITGPCSYSSGQHSEDYLKPALFYSDKPLNPTSGRHKSFRDSQIEITQPPQRNACSHFLSKNSRIVTNEYASQFLKITCLVYVIQGIAWWIYHDNESSNDYFSQKKYFTYTTLVKRCANI